KAVGTDEDELLPDLRLNRRRPLALDTCAFEKIENAVRAKLRMSRIRSEEDPARATPLNDLPRPLDMGAHVDAGRQHHSDRDDRPDPVGNIKSVEQGQKDGIGSHPRPELREQTG